MILKEIETEEYHSILHPDNDIERYQKYIVYYNNQNDKISCLNSLIKLKEGLLNNFRRYLKDSLWIKENTANALKLYKSLLEEQVELIIGSKETQKYISKVEALIYFFDEYVNDDERLYQSNIIVRRFEDIYEKSCLDISEIFKKHLPNHNYGLKVNFAFDLKIQGWVDILAKCLKAYSNQEAIQYTIDKIIENDYPKSITEIVELSENNQEMIISGEASNDDVLNKIERRFDELVKDPEYQKNGKPYYKRIDSQIGEELGYSTEAIRKKRYKIGVKDNRYKKS